MSSAIPMSPERWSRIKQLFESAAALDPVDRNAWLNAECGDDLSLREHIAALLAAGAASDPAFDHEMDNAIAVAARELDTLDAGQTIGRFRIVRLLGRGGMGAVYLAERADQQFEQQVALKLIGHNFPGRALTRRFRAERQILAHLNHPNIARLLDGGASDEGVPYLAMEYVEGMRIDLYCEQQHLDIAQRLRLFQQVCAAIQYAHQNLIVHRDIKPSNILVTSDGTPKLLDFGIAKLLAAPQTGTAEELTRMHERVLTPEHASPEQVRGEPIATVSDVYSLGVLLYELLTCTRPYAMARRSFPELEHVICNVQPLKPSVAVGKDRNLESARTLSQALAGDLDNIVLRAMHKDATRRYPSAAALSDDIQNYLDDRPVLARPDSWRYRARKFVKRNSGSLAATLVIAVAIAGLVIFHTLRVTAERDTAERERQTSAAVSQFMEEVFRVANPSESRGNSVTVREVLDAAVTRIEADLQAQPRVQATLLRTMGQVYNGLGLWEQARELLERAVATEKRQFGYDHLELAQALASLGGVNHNLSRFEIESQLYQEAWDIRRELGRDQDADSATLLSSIAGGLRAQQKFADALRYHREAEVIARQLNPPEPKVLGQVLQGYAMTYLITGDLGAAERYARDSLDLVRDAVYEGNDMYANSVTVLAEALRKQYKLEPAGVLQRELLELQIKRLGDDATMVARTWNNLSHVMRASGRYVESQDALLQAVGIFRKQLGEGSFDLAVGYHNLGGLQNEAGRHAESLASLSEALKLKRQITGAHSPHLVSTLLETSIAHRGLHNLEAAEETLRSAESLAQETFAASDKRFALISLERARLDLANKRFIAARESARIALAAMDHENPGRLSTAQCVLAEALVSSGELEEARHLLEQALATRRRIMPADHWMIADVESLLGEVLSLQRDPQAEKLLARSLTVLEEKRPPGDNALLAAQRRQREHASGSSEARGIGSIP